MIVIVLHNWDVFKWAIPGLFSSLFLSYQQVNSKYVQWYRKQHLCQLSHNWDGIVVAFWHTVLCSFESTNTNLLNLYCEFCKYCWKEVVISHQKIWLENLNMNQGCKITFSCGTELGRIELERIFRTADANDKTRWENNSVARCYDEKLPQ